MLAHPFFAKRQPKSTGKEIFNLRFIPKNLFKQSHEDILATLTEVTALTIARAIKQKEKSKFLSIFFGGVVKKVRFLPD